MTNATKLNSAEIKSIEFALLEKITKLIEELGLRYFLCGGTLLGAVRHQGFIPWDDDIDICMPRKDYETFFQYCEENDIGFDVFWWKSQKVKYFLPFGKICDRNTTVVDDFKRKSDTSTGVWVDIFPLDFFDDKETGRKAIKKIRFCKAMLTASNWGKYHKSLTHPFWYEPPRFFFYIASRFVNRKKLLKKMEKTISKLSCGHGNGAGCVFGSYGSREIVSANAFANGISLPFEEKQFQCPEGYDEYLSSLYGDYMTPPTHKHRVSRHGVIVYPKRDI